MNAYEIQVTATLFIQAENRDLCEQYLKEIITEAGFHNVVVSPKETDQYVDYVKNNAIYDQYEVNWGANK